MRRMTFFLLLPLVLGIVPAGLAAAEDEVARVTSQRIQAFNEGNLEAFMATWADNATWFSVASPFRVEGKEDIQAGFAGLFQNFPTRRYLPRQQSVRVYGDTTAVVTAHFTLILVDRAGKATTTHGRISTTYAKLGGKWMVADQHASAVPASP
jgi:uncharacterized protein (TIGR02246 family)